MQEVSSRPLKNLCALLLLLSGVFGACSSAQHPSATPADSDREQVQGAPLENPQPVREQRMSTTPAAASKPVPPLPVQGGSDTGYIVLQPGETLSYISALYAVSEKDLIAWNGLASPDEVRSGQRIAVRPPGAHAAGRAGITPKENTPAREKSPGEAADTDGTIIVAPGQTLSGIAHSHGVSQADLRRWNGLQNDSLKAGQRLKVLEFAPADGVLGTAPTSTESPTTPRSVQSGNARTPESPNAEGMITVRSGQSLSGIAADYKVNIKDLRSWNALKDDRLKPGQHLRVQRLHTVKAGESLGGIAAKYKTGVKALMEKNKLTSPNIIPVGKQLIIP